MPPNRISPNVATNPKSSSGDVPPFFEPGTAPPTLPILLAQTEVGKIYFPTKLLAQEEVGPKSIHPINSVHSSPYGNAAAKRKDATGVHFSSSAQRAHSSSSRTPHAHTPRGQTPRGQTPRGQTPRAQTHREQTPHSVESSDPDSEEGSQGSEDSPSDEDSDHSDDGLIPKPEGEAGRPGRGGYNLEETLGWEKKQFNKIKAYIKSLIQDHLDPSKSFASQSNDTIWFVTNLAIDRYPILKDYTNAWPAVDMIRLQLKYMASRARRKTDVNKEIVKRLRKRK